MPRVGMEHSVSCFLQPRNSSPDDRASLQELPDLAYHVLARHGAERPGSLSRSRLLATTIDGRPWDAPDPGHPLQAVDLAGGGRGLVAHRLDLR
jgi:hypothetical protein